MSTDISDGYRIDGKKSFVELNQILLDFKTNAHALAKKLAATEIGNAVEAYDFVTLGSRSYVENREKEVKFENNNCLSWANRFVEYKFKQIYKTNSRDPQFDFQCVIVLYPLREDLTLARLVTEKEEYRKLWESIPDISEYGYWNGSDSYPKGVTEKDWFIREKNWNNAIKTSARLGFDVIRTDIFEFSYLDEEELMPFMPSYKDRINEHAFQTALDRVSKQNRIKKYGTSEIKSDEGYHRAMEEYFEARDFLRKEEEGKVFLEKTKEELRGVLKKDITYDELRGIEKE